MTINRAGGADLNRLITQLQIENQDDKAEDVKEKIKARGAEVDAFIAAKKSPAMAGANPMDPGLLGAEDGAAPQQAQIPPGLVFDPSSPTPPDVGPALEQLLLNYDADGNASIDVKEFKAYLMASGMPEAQADQAALAMFANLSPTGDAQTVQLSMKNIDDVQKAMTELWLVENAGSDPQAFLDDLVEKYGQEKSVFGRSKELNAEQLIKGLMADGWSEAAAQSLADSLGLEGNETLTSKESGFGWGFSSGWHLTGNEALRNIESLSRDQGIQQALEAMDTAALFTSQDLTTAGVPPGLIFDISGPIPPEVGPALAGLIAKYDEDGSGTISKEELKAYLLKEGVPEDMAADTADRLFALLADPSLGIENPEELSLDDLPALQDATTQMWLAQNVDNPQEFIGDLVEKYGDNGGFGGFGWFGSAGRKELTRDGLIDGLVADGWTKEAAESLANQLFDPPNGKIGSGWGRDFRAAQKLGQLINKPGLKETAMAIEMTSMFTNSAAAMGPAGGLVFDPAAPFPPDVGPALAQVIESHGGDDGILQPEELVQYMVDAGMTEEAARETAELYLDVLGKDELTVSDMDTLQDGLTEIWLAHNVTNSRDYIEDLIDKYGAEDQKGWMSFNGAKTLDKDALLEGLIADGWSPRAAESLADTIFPQGRTELTAGRWSWDPDISRAARNLDEIVRDKDNQRAGEELAVASLYTNMGAEGPAAGLLFDIYAPHPPDVGPALVHVLQENDADGDGKINKEELLQYMVDAGIPDATAQHLATKIFNASGVGQNGEIGTDDIEKVQDGLNDLWLSVRVADSEAFISDMVKQYGSENPHPWGNGYQMTRDQLLEGLAKDGWSPRAAEALADILFDDGRKELQTKDFTFGRHDLRGAIQDLDQAIARGEAAGD